MSLIKCQITKLPPATNCN